MDFSEPFKLTSRSATGSTATSDGNHPLVTFSPDGKFVANAVQFRLIVRDALDSLQVSVVDAIRFIWSWRTFFTTEFLYLSGKRERLAVT